MMKSSQMFGQVYVTKTDEIELNRDRYGYWELIKIVDGEEWIIRSERLGTSYEELRTAYMLFQVFKSSN
jgi:hypothetical protein